MGRILYHGTTRADKSRILQEGIRLDMNHVPGDFGAGFYLTPNKGIAKERGDGSLLAYVFNSSGLLGRRFYTPQSTEWQEEIYSQRILAIDNNYDVDFVVGPIADGRIGALKIALNENRITKAEFIEAISKGRLTRVMQLVIKTERAAKRLKRIEEEELQ